MKPAKSIPRLPRLPWWALAFALGVLAAQPLASPAAAMALAGSTLAWLWARYPGYRAHKLMLAIALLGMLRMGIARIGAAPTLTPALAAADDRALDTLVGVIDGPIEASPGRRAFALEVRGSRHTLRVWVTVAEGLTAAPTALWPGDRVRVTGRLRRPRGYLVPGGFNHARQAEIRGVQLSMRAHTVEVIGSRWSLWRTPARVQNWAIRVLDEPARGNQGGDNEGGDNKGGDNDDGVRSESGDDNDGVRGDNKGGDNDDGVRSESGDDRDGNNRRADAAAVLRAMVVGDRSGLTPDLTERFQAAGVAHVLAVSGLHLGIVAMLAFACTRRLWSLLPPPFANLPAARAGALVALPVALGFTLVTGARVSTLRALSVAVVVLLGAATGRRARLCDALGAAALAILCAQPHALFAPGFQLSFAATATLALLLSRPRPDPALANAAGATSKRLLATALCRLVRGARELARASLWATLATAPFTALHFGQVALGGLVTNLIAVPLTELVVVPFGLAGLALAPLWPGLATLTIAAATAATGWLVALATLAAAWLPTLSVPPPTTAELLLAAAIWAIAICAARGLLRARRARWLIAIACAVLLASHLGQRTLGSAGDAPTRITFVDVGQGDAAIVELADGGAWLIDSGGLPFLTNAAALSRDERRRQASSPGTRALLPYLRARGIDRLDLAILSHPHPDHYYGLYALLGEIELAELWVAELAPGDPAAPAYRALIDTLAARGARVHHPIIGASYARAGASLTPLAPRYAPPRAQPPPATEHRAARADPVMNMNENSLVIRLDVAGRVVLFTGDIEHEAEAMLAARYRGALQADVVKVPHHGSATSSTAALVDHTRPTWAIISCGLANRFGFPNRAVRARWRAAGARVLTTAERGTVTVTVAADGAIEVAGFDE